MVCRHWRRMCWSLSDCLYCSFDSYSHEVGRFRNVDATFAAHVEFHVHKLSMTRSWHVWNLSIACPSHFTCPKAVHSMYKPVHRHVHAHVQNLSKTCRFNLFMPTYVCCYEHPSWTVLVPSRNFHDTTDVPCPYHMTYHYGTICRIIFVPYVVPFSYHPIPRPYRFRAILSPIRTIFVPFIYRIYIAALDVCWWHHDDRRFHAVVSRWYHVWKPSK